MCCACAKSVSNSVNVVSVANDKNFDTIFEAISDDLMIWTEPGPLADEAFAEYLDVLNAKSISEYEQLHSIYSDDGDSFQQYDYWDLKLEQTNAFYENYEVTLSVLFDDLRET